MRNRRIRSAATAATTALLAALALTACQPSDVVNADPKPDSTATSAATDEPDSQATDKQQPPADENADSGSGSEGDSNKSSGSGKNDSADKGSDAKSAARTTCTGSNTKVTVTDVARPLNHLLVTATNTGDRNCDAYYAPLLGFDDAQSVTQINEDSKPQAVVTLAPGESAYASIALGGVDGAPTTAAYKLSVHFAGRDNQGSVGSAANLTLPKGTATTADTSVSYWQSTMADALTW
ncbi:DUF4232 domain-containing protein [Streptomyces sp. IB2014 016-6]|uniref:DUF4232 domain-containing protein n=1 Tax=Streptomyces sp. IB2014 016-6 TaxID=2517818 RepID=UPI0011CCB352|nr:DUF4232 domain-containing protein [Streptomyces sp. IB2014 016-6]TXL90499.1 DUF4232 domain-containing protein [Streptomyces sp. IB2014 016-6]